MIFLVFVSPQLVIAIDLIVSPDDTFNKDANHSTCMCLNNVQQNIWPVKYTWLRYSTTLNVTAESQLHLYYNNENDFIIVAANLTW